LRPGIKEVSLLLLNELGLGHILQLLGPLLFLFFVLFRLLLLLLLGPLSVVFLLILHDESQLIVLILCRFLMLVGCRIVVVTPFVGGWGLVGFVQILQELVVFICDEVKTARLSILFNEVLELTKDFGL
jgi:hypothetical protein